MKDAQTIKGTNPRYLVEKIIISRIYDCKYWKEDFRKIRTQDREGKYHLSHMDEFVNQLLREERVCDVQLPRLQNDKF